MTNYLKSPTVAFRLDTDAKTVAIIGVFYGGQDHDAALIEPER